MTCVACVRNLLSKTEYFIHADRLFRYVKQTSSKLILADGFTFHCRHSGSDLWPTASGTFRAFKFSVRRAVHDQKRSLKPSAIIHAIPVKPVIRCGSTKFRPTSISRLVCVTVAASRWARPRLSGAAPHFLHGSPRRHQKRWARCTRNWTTMTTVTLKPEHDAVLQARLFTNQSRLAA